MPSADMPPIQEEFLEKKPFHPVETAMLILCTVCLLGAISITSSHIFGRYLLEGDAETLDAGITPAQKAIEAVQKKDPEMKKMLAPRPTRDE